MNSIHLEPIDKSTFANPGNLGVTAEQTAFVNADLIAYVKTWKNDGLFYCFHIVLNGQTQVGFFALDFSVERHRTFVLEESGACILRGFFIDQRYQGMGYSTQALRSIAAKII